MHTEVITALIAGFVTLITSMGTWHFSAGRDRYKTREDLIKQLNAYYEKNREAIADMRQNDLQEIRGDVTDMSASLQSKIAVIEEQISTLSTSVERHNHVIERTYKLEQAVADLRDK